MDVPVRGEIREGTVVSTALGEILIDIGGKSEGVIDNRELERMSRDERAQFDVGEQVQVCVVNTENRDGNIVLSLDKAAEEMDWRWVAELLDSQDVYEGTITGHNKGVIDLPSSYCIPIITFSQMKL